MRTLAHIVNPFIAPADSDLAVAQPITFASMLRAQADAAEVAKVELWSAQFTSDRGIVPTGFAFTSDLDRSVLDLGQFQRPMQLPLIKDIMDRLHQASQAEYLIYTNVDIGVMPDFYQQVNAFIEAGHDAFVINRRRLPEHYTTSDQLEAIYQDRGKSHPGFDCFVLHRDLYPQFSLGDICIGVPFIGIGMAQNLFCFAENPRVFADEHLTFHIGMELFKKRAPKDYFVHNQQAFWAAMNHIRPQLDSRKWPWGDRPFPERMIRWGLHPSLPIRLALQLEGRRW